MSEQDPVGDALTGLGAAFGRLIAALDRAQADALRKAINDAVGDGALVS